MGTEIERKWVADRPPADDVIGSGTSLRQGYVALDGDVTVRVRIAPEQAWLTIKAGGDALRRTEVELPLALSDAEQLWTHSEGRQLVKTRHRIPVGAHIAEVDVFAGALDGLCVIEVEFDTEDDATDFVAPEWFGREVTGDPAWSNASLATAGLPPDL